MTMHERNLEIVKEFAQTLANGETTKERAEELAESYRERLCKVNRVSIYANKWADLLVQVLLNVYFDAISTANLRNTDVAHALTHPYWYAFSMRNDFDAAADRLASVRMRFNEWKREAADFAAALMTDEKARENAKSKARARVRKARIRLEQNRAILAGLKPTDPGYETARGWVIECEKDLAEAEAARASL